MASSASWGSPATTEEEGSWGPPSTWGPSRPEFDGDLGACAQVLMHNGDTKAAALLWDVQELDLQWADNAGPDWQVMDATLTVEPWILGRFDDETKEKIRHALNTVLYRRRYQIGVVQAVPRPAAEGWREQMKDALEKDPLNQATLAPLPTNYPKADGLAFRTPEEVRVYQALKQVQEQRASDDTFSIIPNCAVRFLNRTLEPDFIINFRGRCAAIEVDGASHDRKWGSDKSRDDLLMESGLLFVKRLDARDMANPQELQAAISRFLNKLERGQ